MNVLVQSHCTVLKSQAYMRASRIFPIECIRAYLSQIVLDRRHWEALLQRCARGSDADLQASNGVNRGLQIAHQTSATSRRAALAMGSSPLRLARWRQL